MRGQRFRPCVWVHGGGLNFRLIANAEEAISYLLGWQGHKAAIYDHALRTMEAALRGEIEDDLARDVFRRFAAAEGTLAETKRGG